MQLRVVSIGDWKNVVFWHDLFQPVDLYSHMPIMREDLLRQLTAALAEAQDVIDPTKSGLLDRTDCQQMAARLASVIQQVLETETPCMPQQTDCFIGLGGTPDLAPRGRRKGQMPKVLVVDDDLDVCRVLVRLLKGYGMDAAYVTSGQECLNFIQSHPADVMLLDIMMPGINGFDVLQRIRASKELSALPVVMYSAHSEPEIRQQARSLGANDFVAKADDSFEVLQATLWKYVNPQGYAA